VNKNNIPNTPTNKILIIVAGENKKKSATSGLNNI
jgi:hypothetical protein